MRTRKHYVNLLESNPGTTWGISLAAQAVYAAKNGMFDRNHNFDEGYYRKTYLRLQAQYGEVLSPDEVRTEMDLVGVMSRLGSRTSEKKAEAIVDGKRYSIRKDSELYYEKHGISPKVLSDKQTSSGHYWIKTGKPF